MGGEEERGERDRREKREHKEKLGGGVPGGSVCSVLSGSCGEGYLKLSVYPGISVIFRLTAPPSPLLCLISCLFKSFHTLTPRLSLIQALHVSSQG